MFNYVALRPNAGQGLLILEISGSHTMTHNSRLDSSERVISASQRPLPDNTQHSQQTDIHAPGGIRTHNLSWQAALDIRLRPRGHCDRLYFTYTFEKTRTFLNVTFKRKYEIWPKREWQI